MSETSQLLKPSFNRSLRIESSGILGWMAARMKDPRSQVDVTHDLASLSRSTVLLDALARYHGPALGRSVAA
jgi:hypothetical protein